MAETATAEYYRKQNELNKAKLKTDYEQYLADLATKYGISSGQLNANLESRGILRSGEAGTAQTRLGAANEAAKTTATTNYDYNVASEDVNLATQLAGLQSSTPAATPAPATPATTTVDYSGVDFNALGRWMAQIEKDKKDKAQVAAAPGLNWNAVAGWGGGTGNRPATTTVTPPKPWQR